MNSVFELGTGRSRNATSSNFYGAALSGFFVPPQDGNYTFFMQHDDGGEFVIYTAPPSTQNPAGVSTGMLTDTAVQGSYADSDNCRSPLLCKPAQRYYMEGRMKQGTGGNYFRVGVRFPTDIRTGSRWHR